MQRHFLRRIGEHHGATLGVLICPDYECVTLEEAWRQNRSRISCIPLGVYPISRVQSAHGTVVALAHVADRAGILIHAGNTIRDTEGCILPGMSFGRLAGSVAVLKSAVALASVLMQVHDGDVLEVS